MPFDPHVNQEIKINNVIYRIAPHPSALEMPYGQQGRAGTVYRLDSDGESLALKVFNPRFLSPNQASLARKLAPLATVSGMTVCRRTILTPQAHESILHQYPALIYAVLMPWIDGPTWMQVLQEKILFTPQQSLYYARSFSQILSEMEQEGLAHGDLSAPNLILPGLFQDTQRRSFAPVEMVDVEGMYAKTLDRPENIPSGSEGYAHRSVRHEKLWNDRIDRFAGAILLAEMLGWCDVAVRGAAWGESYFDPQELQQESARFTLLRSSIQKLWGEPAAHLLEAAWNSELLADCPTFGEWFLKIPNNATQASISIESNDPVKNEQNTADQNGSVSVLLSLAERLYKSNNLHGAIETFHRALELSTSTVEQEKIKLKILEIEAVEKQANHVETSTEMGRKEEATLNNTSNDHKRAVKPAQFFSIAALIVFVFGVALTALAGQGKAPAISSSPTVSLTKTISPSKVISLTFTQTPTVTHTPLPTKTITPTATQVPTHTSTPVPTSVPQAKILYQENFEKGKPTGWDNRSSTPIQILEENGNHFMHYLATGFAYPGIWKETNNTWKNYAFESKIRLKKDGVFVCFRLYGKPGAFYNVFLDKENNYIVYADYDPSRKESDQYQTFGGVNHYLNTDWHLVRVEVNGESLSVYIDNTLISSVNRSSLSYGGIAYYTGENKEFDIDDIRVWSLDK